jgi:hypothetical protein
MQSYHGKLKILLKEFSLLHTRNKVCRKQMSLTGLFSDINRTGNGPLFYGKEGYYGKKYSSPTHSTREEFESI